MAAIRALNPDRWLPPSGSLFSHLSLARTLADWELALGTSEAKKESKSAVTGKK
jgi:hypothetical protein